MKPLSKNLAIQIVELVINIIESCKVSVENYQKAADATKTLLAQQRELDRLYRIAKEVALAAQQQEEAQHAAAMRSPIQQGEVGKLIEALFQVVGSEDRVGERAGEGSLVRLATTERMVGAAAFMEELVALDNNTAQRPELRGEIYSLILASDCACLGEDVH